MLEQIARVMFWLCVGEIAARSGLLPLPAPVTGLILLYADLAVRGKLPDDLGVLADRLLQFTGATVFAFLAATRISRLGGPRAVAGLDE